MNRNDLNRAIEKKSVIRITTRYPKHEHTSGILRKFSEEFWLLQNLAEFHLDGYTLFPTWNIAALRAARYERAQDQIVKGEGILKRVGLDMAIDLAGPRELFESLQGIGKSIIIQNRDQAARGKGTEVFFLIGKITDVRDSKVAVHNFNACGILDSKPTYVAFKDIVLIHFEKEYINVFSKYVKKAPKRVRRKKEI